MSLLESGSGETEGSRLMDVGELFRSVPSESESDTERLAVEEGGTFRYEKKVIIIYSTGLQRREGGRERWRKGGERERLKEVGREGERIMLESLYSVTDMVW